DGGPAPERERGHDRKIPQGQAGSHAGLSDLWIPVALQKATGRPTFQLRTRVPVEIDRRPRGNTESRNNGLVGRLLDVSSQGRYGGAKNGLSGRAAYVRASGR